MSSSKLSAAAVILRVVIVFSLSIVFFAAASVGILQGTFMNAGVQKMDAVGGVIDMRGEAFDQSMPVILHGEWEYYPSIFQAGDQFYGGLLEGKEPQIASMPLNQIEKAQGPSTYRLQIKTDFSMDDYSFYLEHYHEDFAIYVNGIRVMPVSEGSQEKMLYSLSDYLFTIAGSPEGEITEIIISANSNRNQALLYRNTIIFGETSSVVDHVARIWRDETFLIGVILVMIAVGLIFMLIHTKFDMLSGITMFDTFIALRILLGYKIATYFIHQVFSWTEISRIDFVILQYVAFFITGTCGCLLSQRIFDSEKKLPVWPIRGQVILCIAGTVLTIYCYKWIPNLCVGLLFAVLVVSFLIVTWHVYHLVRQKRCTAFYVFQIIKTYYIGGVMAVDILFLRGEFYNSMVYCYVIFLFAHLLARLIDSNASYKEAERLNYNLEKIISERTGELTRVNERLSELSVRDPLTKVYNRLYFEEYMGQVLRENKMAEIYLCMFDLDFFKRINDQFGHGAGDEQLQFVVHAVQEVVKEKGLFARVGGEEFVIFFSNQSRGRVMGVLEEIRRRLDRDAKANEKRTTASFGIVKHRAGEMPKDLMKAADKCLYVAKKLGRNCIVAN